MLNKAGILAIGVGLGCAAPAFAEIKTAGDWEFYGRAHFSIDSLDDGADYNRINASSNSSRLGFRGSKSFGDLKGIWQIEQEIFFNLNGSNTEALNRFATRDTYAGLQGKFGQVRFGKFDTPFKVARDPANLFGDQVGDMRNLTRVGDARFDERPNNILEYQSPVMNGFRVKVAYALHEAASATVTNGTDKKDASTSAALHYAAGRLDAALAYESYGKDASYGKRDATRLAVGYKVTDTLKLVGFYQDANHTPLAGKVTDGGQVMGIGAEYQLFADMTLRAHYMSRSADKANADATMYTVGVEKKIDNALRLYVNLAQVNNDPAANLTPWVQGRSTTQAGVAGKDSRAISFGMRYDF